MGAALAQPERRVICLIGDGGFNMNIQEQGDNVVITVNKEEAFKVQAIANVYHGGSVDPEVYEDLSNRDNDDVAPLLHFDSP
ncbi:MAG: hypothetical protein IIB03_09500 [Acidobacteria bacterium]|nr:hypothetical protein [Acidobacteriota bacterium]